MNNLIIKEFNGEQKLITIMWRGKAVWVAKQIAELSGQADVDGSVNYFIQSNDWLEEDIDYEVLKSKELKEFKKVTEHSSVTSKYTAQLTIFYESGLWAYLQSLRTDVGKQLRLWVNREVLPSIRQTGAYITEKADPEMLRKKANEIESLTTINETANILLPLFEKAGLKPQYQLLAAKQLYKKANIDLPVEEMKAEREIYDLQSIAVKTGVYSKSNKPHGQAIKVILDIVGIEEDEKEVVSFEKNGHVGTMIQYAKSVIDKVEKWLKDSNYPEAIKTEKKTFSVIYKEKKVA